MGEPSDEDVGCSQKYMFPTANTASRVSAEASEEPDSSHWQTVGRRRAHSLDSAEPAHEKIEVRGQAPREKISATIMKPGNAVQTVAEAPQPKAVQHRQETSTESRRGELSHLKGKGRDPRKWENIHLNEQEMDTALQQAALESYQEQGQHNGSLKRHKHHRRLDQGQEPSQQ